MEMGVCDAQQYLQARRIKMRRCIGEEWGWMNFHPSFGVLHNIPFTFLTTNTNFPSR